MTCFWDALRSRLNINKSNQEFINFLKNNNTKEITILWNNEEFTKKQLEENFEHIRDFNENNIENGYLCSICDPFLILVCELYDINIEHNYNGYTMYYKSNNTNKTLFFYSDLGHFR